MTKQRKINSTYAIVMVIGLAFMLLFGQAIQYSYRNRCKDAGCSDWSNHYHLL